MCLNANKFVLLSFFSLIKQCENNVILLRSTGCFEKFFLMFFLFIFTDYENRFCKTKYAIPYSFKIEELKY